ncbi:MAG: sodium-independent anion transporter [Hyphomicrobiales bacterium]|nr:MAG: sodium-independent anion transporter [Hyphomicrobiales bacterium]
MSFIHLPGKSHRLPLRFHIPVPHIGWFGMVNRKTLPADLIAGLTGAIIVLPQGVAFATIAGMPPEYGLYAAIVPTIIAALFGSSWHLVAGPSTTASLVLATSLTAFAGAGTHDYVQLAITLAFMVGLMELMLGVFRLGAIVNFISHSVIVGFTAGVGIVIILTQIRNFTGMTLPKGLPTYDIVPYVLAHFSEVDSASLIVGLATLATGVAVKRFVPRVPFMIVALLVGSLAGLALNTYAGADIATVGHLPSHLPPLSMPTFSLETWTLLLPTALALAISALNESVSISRALAVRSGQHVDPNQEFIGQGLANTIGSFFSGYVVSSSFNRSALNYSAGARTPMSAMIAGLSLAGIIMVAAPLAHYLPYPAMAASLFLIGWDLIDRKNIAQILKTSRPEAGILLWTLLVAVFVQVQFAILAGVGLSLVVYLYRTSNPRIVHLVPDPASTSRKMTETRSDLPECPQFHMIRFNGSLFFGAVNAFRDELVRCEKRATDCRHLAIVMAGVNFIDVAGAEMLAQMAKRYRERGAALYLIGPNRFVLNVLEQGGYLDTIGHANVFDSKTTAFRTVYNKLNHGICQSCPLNVFVECARKGKLEPGFADMREDDQAA